MKRILLSVGFIFIFLGFLVLGFRIASQKPLWNDEIYSQLSSVENITYRNIIFGKVGEGNAAPLFYLMQKTICRLAGYHAPVEWQAPAGNWDFDRLVDRIVLRIGPVTVSAMAVTLIFFYMIKFFSWQTAFFSLLLSVSNQMVLQYMPEARPYALWIFLTTVQSLSFLALIEKPGSKDFLVKLLIATHILLSLTVVLSAAQILLVSVLLWGLGFREKKIYFFLLILPILIVVYYFLLSPKYPFGLIFSFEQYLRANVSRDRFYLAFLYILALSFYIFQRKLRFKNIFNEQIVKGLPALGLFFCAVGCAAALLAIFKFKEGPLMQFPVTEKYLIFLAPVGTICIAVFVDVMVRSAKTLWLKGSLLLIILSLFVPRMIKVLGQFSKQYPNLFF